MPAKKVSIKKAKNASGKLAKPVVAANTEEFLDQDAIVAALGQMLEQQGAIPFGETQSLLKSLKHFDLEVSVDSAHDEAQDIAFDAMEAPTRAKAVALYKNALRIDPDCVDAIAGLAHWTANTTQEEIVALQRAVEAGERFFGPAFFKKHRGEFWSLIETRPYMRARQQLASLLLDVGMMPDAIGHFEALLLLNPHDNQGVREQLLGAYLRIGDRAGAQKLLKKYKYDGSAVFAWGAVLEHLLCERFDEAATALSRARKQNPFVEQYVTGQKKLPGIMPEMYSPGSPEEAELCMDGLKFAWAAHRNALDWLRSKLLQR